MAVQYNCRVQNALSYVLDMPSEGVRRRSFSDRQRADVTRRRSGRERSSMTLAGTRLELQNAFRRWWRCPCNRPPGAAFGQAQDQGRFVDAEQRLFVTCALVNLLIGLN